MTKQDLGDFCFDFAHASDGGVAFRCSEDARKWEWLRLHPAHAIAVQSTNYYALTGVSAFSGRMDGGKWTALTSFRWKAFNTGEGAKHPVRGVAHQGGPKDIGYACKFYDAMDLPVYDVSGEGVIFKTRDFEGWRAKAKAEILKSSAPENFEFAAPADVGVAKPVEGFISPVRERDDAKYVDALVTKETGFQPHHPYIGGSGDHVNSTHIFDVAQQAAVLLGWGLPSGGSARFQRYIELDRPFRVAITTQSDKGCAFLMSQGRYNCAEVDLEFNG